MLERAVSLEELKELLPVARARKWVPTDTAVGISVGRIERHVSICDALMADKTKC